MPNSAPFSIKNSHLFPQYHVCLPQLRKVKKKKKKKKIEMCCFFCVCFLYPTTKVWRGIMLYPSVSVRLSVRPSVRPCSPFPIDNLSIYSRNFFKFCIHIVIGDEWYGIVNGQNPSIFNGVTALFRIGKMVSGLLFLYCSWYLNETSQICCTSKVTYCD